jgi:hypothetical protein
LAHVVQREPSEGHQSPLIQRRLAKPSEKSENRETLLGIQLREPQFSNGVSIAFYDHKMAYAKSLASDWARRENAIGLKDFPVSVGNLVIGKAIPDTQDIAMVVSAIGRTLRAALAKAPAPESYPPETADAPARIHALALFAHGLPGMCLIGPTPRTRQRERELAKAVAPELGNNARVIMFACSTARTWEEREDADVEQTMTDGGADSPAGRFRDTLVDKKVTSASVWGHSIRGKVSKSMAHREFQVADGKGQPGKSFPANYVFTQEEREAAVADLVEELTRRGYSVDSKDPRFRSKALEKLTRAMYGGYISAGKKLTGPPVSEEIPLNPWENAFRIREYWRTDYWPRKKSELAAELAKALGLKEQARRQ